MSDEGAVQPIKGKWGGDKEQRGSDWGADEVPGGRELIDGKQFLQEDGGSVWEVWWTAENDHKAKFASDQIIVVNNFESQMRKIQVWTVWAIIWMRSVIIIDTFYLCIIY